jgi:alcohol dehydrogenase class IV
MFFSFASAGQLVFGSGSVARLGRLVAERGYGRALVVTDGRLVEAGLLGQAADSLTAAGIAHDAFVEGEPEPSIDIALRCQTTAAEFGPDVIVALGGGSNMDLAKIVAVLLAHGGAPADYFGAGNVPGPVTPLVCVPTTAGTGSEVSHAAVLTDTAQAIKVSTLSEYLRPTLAVVDPLLTLGCPAKVTADSGIDALTHAIEALTATDNTALGLTPASDELPPYFGRHPLGDCLAEQAISLIGRCLRTAVAHGDDLPAREGMALAATLAGMAFSNCGVALVHGLEYPLGGATHCSHGAGNGLLLPYVMRFNLPERQATLARIAPLLGEATSGASEAEAAELAIAAVERLRADIGIPARLRELGAREDQLPEFAAKTFQIKRLLTFNPRAASEADLLDILRSAW